MDLRQIEEQLNAVFAREETRLVFWFDDKADYVGEVDELSLPQAQIYQLTGKNWFQAKCDLNDQESNQKYLVYAPFARPDDQNNPLADMYYYSVPFYTDKISQLCQTLQIPEKLKSIMERYRDFWGNEKERVIPFTHLNIDRYTQDSIEIGMLCVLASVKTYSFEEVVKQVLVNDADWRSEFASEMQKFGLTEGFWNQVKKNYGYMHANPTAEDFVTSLFMTYMSVALQDSMPTDLLKYTYTTIVDEYDGKTKNIDIRKNDVSVLLRNVMDNVNYVERYDEIADSISRKLNLPEKCKDVPLEEVLDCDAFEFFDHMLMAWMTVQLTENLLDSRISGRGIGDICTARMMKSYHFGRKYQNEYTVLKAAYQMLCGIQNIHVPTQAKDFITEYDKKWYEIDLSYRHFYNALDKVDDTSDFEALRKHIEATYANAYLAKVTPKWNAALTEGELQKGLLPLQKNFYRSYLRGYPDKERMIVIVSDAMRYECAKELLQKLELDEKCEGNLDYMLGSLPSITKLGMASILPNEEISYDDVGDVFIGDMKCDDLVSRDKILKKLNERNCAYSFEQVKEFINTQDKEKLQDKHIIYIYHNQIDARGDKPASENEVFRACEEAIQEIIDLMKRLTSFVTATKFIVTADHGFLYRRAKLESYDKIPLTQVDVSYSSKRFLISKEPVVHNAMVSRAMTYLNKMNELYVTTPIGADIFQVPGAGQNYVHGGSSMQEMLVPVIQVQTKKGKVKNVNSVDVVLTSATRKVTNLITYLDFIQDKPVTELNKARMVVAYFESESGEKISFDVPITADITETDARKRTFREKFTLKSKQYNRKEKYYLKLVDANDEKNVLQQYEFIVDIAFADDFGF